MRSTRQRTMWAQRCRPCRQPAALSQGWPRKMCVPGPSHGTSLKSLQCTLATIALCKKLLRAWKLPYPFLSTQLCTPTMIPTDNAVDPHRCDLLRCNACAQSFQQHLWSVNLAWCLLQGWAAGQRLPERLATTLQPLLDLRFVSRLLPGSVALPGGNCRDL